ncbi:protein GlmU [Desulfobotulus sp.]|jgi:UDP-N-acetylglucosamine/UDP-N-acetylgalactosamine diphosphorylase|uniref:protein GlmU n=1 Tax=Desulfobotulus sp. TaxID=1940337 RepID=UPI002A35F9D9|nr:protein GlmU [Desulfobotulus sp.]MDY0161777.1 protein GlmU [Desulfobotulus sp.]
MKSICARLLEKGVRMPDPLQVCIAEDVDLERIEPGVTLYPGSRISGEETLLLTGTRIGEEGPATLHNVRTGREVRLKGGFFQDAVFLEKASAGTGSHVRGGSILEEGASIAHTVGLKQTILFPYVTLGSLINFCDIFMAGGTGPKNHSEVGSSYIHFNFTPDQDKATASMLGDVPSGVMLDKAPIFLGGQGGLVGPCRLAFGTVIAAGTLQRKDELRENRLLFGSSLKAGNVERKAGLYPGLRRILENNFFYIANLHALKAWYVFFRSRLISPFFPESLLQGLVTMVDAGISERVERLLQLREKIRTLDGASLASSPLHSAWVERAESVCAFLAETEKAEVHAETAVLKDFFFKDLTFDKTYLGTLALLDEKKREAGRAWLSSVVHTRLAGAWRNL